MDYEATKIADRRTATRCAAEGIRFVPMVLESLGGWGPMAQGILHELARATALKEGLPEALAINQLYQALGIRLQRANARAILARIGHNAASSSTALATPSTLEAALVLTQADTTG